MDCKDSVDISMLPVALYNKCKKGKCKEGETNDGKECNEFNKCYITYENFEDIPVKFRYKFRNNCYDTRTLIDIFESGLNSYNYQPSPKFPSDPYTNSDFRVREIKEIVGALKKSPFVLEKFLNFGDNLLNDLFNNNVETLRKKYSATKRSAIISNKFRSLGLRYLIKYEGNFLDVTDRPYGVQGEAFGWVSKEYIQNNRDTVRMFYNMNTPVQYLFEPVHNWTGFIPGDLWTLSHLQNTIELTENDIRIITAPREILQKSSSEEKIACYRNVSNYSKKNIQKGKFTFDSDKFERDNFKLFMDIMAPKLKAMLLKIQELDSKDQEMFGKKFKHFIFSEFTGIGSKMIGTYLVSHGYPLVYEVTGTSRKKLIYKEEKKKDRFALLSSNSLFDLTVSKRLTKEIINKFNERPKNVNGDYIRFIVADKGFQEGVDLFDVKYVHIFEEQKTEKAYNQAIGRAFRRCGTVGLNFVNNEGWIVKVFNYKSQLDSGEFIFEKAMSFDNTNKTIINTANAIEKILPTSSVDYFINNFPGEPVDTLFPLPNLDMDPIDYQKAVLSKFSKYKITNSGELKSTCSPPEKGVKIVTLSKAQNFLKDFFTPESPQKGLIVAHSIGSGKCHAKDTPIMMYDGSIKLVQDIQENDLLMGDDSTPRTVTSLARGQDLMYEIKPVKGDSYTVNQEHILCLKVTSYPSLKHSNVNNNYNVQWVENNEFKSKTFMYNSENKKEKEIESLEFRKKINWEQIIEMTVIDYNKLSKSRKKLLKGYRVPVNFKEQNLPIDPYMIGYWLGDGTSRDSTITTRDSTVLHYFAHELRHKYDLILTKRQSLYSYGISSINGNKNNNLFLNTLNQLNLRNNKHIPDIYKINSRINRLKLLAGLIDSDGSYQKGGYEFSQKNEKLMDDIIYLCRSLGFACYKSVKKTTWGVKKEGEAFRIQINGKGIEQIPVKIRRKYLGERKQKKDVLVTGISIIPKNCDDYYGFTLDGNSRYILGDFTVTHNTCSAIATASHNWKGKTIIWVTKPTLIESFWKNVTKDICEANAISNIDRLKSLKNPKRILTKTEWVQPMSYRQFTNLIKVFKIPARIEKNEIALRLLRKNGRADPFRNTLVIFDEAHQIFEPNPRISPDIKELEKMVDKSYSVSGKNSIKFMLLSATPLFGNLKNHQENFFKLLNLIKEEKLPESYPQIKQKYFDTNGNFTENGLKKFRDDLKGLVTYLDITKDYSQFAKPVFVDIVVPVVSKPEKCSELNKRLNESCKKTKTEQMGACTTQFNLDTRNCNSSFDKKGCVQKAKEDKKNCNDSTKENFKVCNDNRKKSTEECKKKKKDLKGVLYTKDALMRCE